MQWVAPPPRLSRLLPGDPTRYHGPHWTLAALAGITVVGTARSLLHILKDDSGASSIASMETAVAGSPNSIGLPTQWGGAQVLESVRYRSCMDGL